MLALISHIPNPLQDSLFSPEQPVRFSLAESVCQESGGKIRNPAKGCIIWDKDEIRNMCFELLVLHRM